MTNPNLSGVRACVFDAYGTLFDVNSAAQQAQNILPENWQQLAEVWRMKQLQYTWLRSLTGRHVDFWQLTVEALEFAFEEVKVYKPHPTVYQLAVDRLGLEAREICFVSSNGWDAYSAKAFGFHVIWCNRSGQVPERIPETPDAEIAALSELPEIVGVP